MTTYLDTSLLVAALTIEVGSAASQAWLDRATGRLLISSWTLTEFSSALALKVRTGTITPHQRAAAMTQFTRTASQSLIIVPVGSNAFAVAARFADHEESKLSAGDALHLAIAADHGAAVATLDRRQAAAGPIVGVPTHLVA